jgi:hypothetical protein
MKTIGLDELLSGHPSWDQVVDFWINGEFYEERYLIEAIRKYLLTGDQYDELRKRNMSVEDILNGRIEGVENINYKYEIFRQWNRELGIDVFGFNPKPKAKA